MKNILILDRDLRFVESLARYFKGYKNISIFCVQALDHALSMIDTFKPDVLFLGHDLSDDRGGEGLEIARHLKDSNVKMFSIAPGFANPFVSLEYESLNVQWIGKNVESVAGHVSLAVSG